MQLSEHFHLSEFVSSQTAARRRIDNTPPAQAIDNLRRLCKVVLEPIREHFGPVIISSGYRSPALNRAVGGAATSQHVAGEAADIEVPGVSNVELAEWIARSGRPFDQLILEFYTPGDPSSGWVHVSYSLRRRRYQVLTARRVRRLGRLVTEYVPGIAP